VTCTSSEFLIHLPFCERQLRVKSSVTYREDARGLRGRERSGVSARSVFFKIVPLRWDRGAGYRCTNWRVLVSFTTASPNYAFPFGSLYAYELTENAHVRMTFRCVSIQRFMFYKKMAARFYRAFYNASYIQLRLVPRRDEITCISQAPIVDIGDA